MTSRSAVRLDERLRDIVGRAGATLAGSLYAVPEPLREDAARELGRRGHWTHADVFGDPDEGVHLGLIADLVTAGVGPIDVHLIDAAALWALPQVCRLGVDRITLPREAFAQPQAWETAKRDVRSGGAQVWSALAPETDPAGQDSTTGTACEGALLMLIQPGTRGRADTGLLSKATRLAAGTRLGVDGGVTADNVTEALAAGVHYIVAGRSLFRVEEGIPA